MRLLDKLRGLLHRDSGPVADHGRHDLRTVVAKAGRTAVRRAAIAADLPSYNRATRRLYGFYGRAVPLDWVQPESSFFVPRYVRRHREVLSTWPLTTRRQRKQRAKMIRLVHGYGLLSNRMTQS